MCDDDAMRSGPVKCIAAAAALAAALSACSDPPASASPDGWSACYVGSDAGATCYATELVEADDKLHALNDCRSGNGLLMEACPRENLIGSCGRQSAVQSAQGVVPRQVRLFYYLQPNLTNATAIDIQMRRCTGNGGDWQYPPR